jgi:alpha-tubulin suppressor-like RCC1 family protein
VTVTGLDGAVDISAGEAHACALLESGALECWGFGYSFGSPHGVVSVPVAIAGLGSGIKQVAAGEEHTCVLLGSGGVQCWGFAGEQEPGSDFTNPTPQDVQGISGATAIASGDGYACALLGSGGVQCWGGNQVGELGTGSTTPSDSSTPLPVFGLTSGVVALGTLGGRHTCAVLAGGQVRCWGFNDYGQLGNGSNINSATPVTVSGLAASVVSVASGGEEHSCALLSSGDVECWGADALGQLGNNSELIDSLVPIPVGGLDPATAEVVTGDAFSCARGSSGSVKCWGDNGSGQIGTGCTAKTNQPCLAPVDIAGL